MLWDNSILNCEGECEWDDVFGDGELLLKSISLNTWTGLKVYLMMSLNGDYHNYLVLPQNLNTFLFYVVIYG